MDLSSRLLCYTDCHVLPTLLVMNFLFNPIVTLFLQSLRELCSARLYDASVEENVNMVGLDVAQYSLVVGYYHDAHFGSNQPVDPFGDYFDRVNVQTRVCFVQNGYFRLQNSQLEYFTPFF